jgi:hypothetical protein
MRAQKSAAEGRNNSNTTTTASTANTNNNRTSTNNTTTNNRITEPQSSEDMVQAAIKRMSVEDRKLFLSNILKTEKYKSSLAVVSSGGNESSSFRKIFKRFSPDSCSICLETFQKGDEMCASPNRACSHIFHRDCILDWLLTHEICPICRRNYLQLDNCSSMLELGCSHDMESGTPLDTLTEHPDSSGMDDMVTAEANSFMDGSSDQQPVTESAGPSMNGDTSTSNSTSDNNRITI